MIASIQTTWQRHCWLRFRITVGVSTAFSYSVFALLVFMGLGLIRMCVSACVAGALMVLPPALSSFFLQKYLVFPREKAS